jgi:hypothetical protein
MINHINYKDDTDDYYHFYKLRYTEFDNKNGSHLTLINIIGYLFNKLSNANISYGIFRFVTLTHSLEYVNFHNYILTLNFHNYIDKHDNINIDVNRINELFYKDINHKFIYDDFLLDLKNKQFYYI